MSAYVVHPDTIDLITSAGALFAPEWDRGVRFPSHIVRLPMVAAHPVRAVDWMVDQDAIARCLYAENVHSVNVRYRLDDPMPDYRFQAVNLRGFDRLVPVVLKSIACLQYQSCEADDYDQSAASYLLKSLERMIICSLYGDAEPWGWERPTVTTEVTR